MDHLIFPKLISIPQFYCCLVILIIGALAPCYAQKLKMLRNANFEFE